MYVSSSFSVFLMDTCVCIMRNSADATVWDVEVVPACGLRHTEQFPSSNPGSSAASELWQMRTRQRGAPRECRKSMLELWKSYADWDTNTNIIDYSLYSYFINMFCNSGLKIPLLWLLVLAPAKRNLIDWLICFVSHCIGCCQTKETPWLLIPAVCNNDINHCGSSANQQL